MIAGLKKALDALLFPRRANCMGCGAATGCREDWVCPECRQALAQSWVGAEPPPCASIAASASAYVHRGPAAGIVRRLKYSGVGQLAGFMAEDMVRAYRFIEPTGADCVTCVPMHRRRLRMRGGNHAERLAREVAAALGLPYIDALERVRDTPQQARLDDKQRRMNLRDAFHVRQPLEGRRVLLVDDVCTTGSTAAECASAMLRGGAEKVFLLCYTRAGKGK